MDGPEYLPEKQSNGRLDQPLLQIGHSALETWEGFDKPLLTIKEAALLLRCSKAHVQNLIAGKVACAAPLPYIQLGRRKLIRRESLLRWMEKAENRC
jgi:excisionase family DNA binding protein